MSDDDDTGHHHSKVVAVLQKTLPALKVWHVAAIALAAFIAGAWIF